MLSLFLSIAIGPSTDDLRHFPSGSTSWCARQDLQTHRQKLDEIRMVCGYTAAWAQAVEETEWQTRYWHLLDKAHDCANGEEWGLVAGNLFDLREHIGPDRYAVRWHPPIPKRARK